MKKVWRGRGKVVVTVQGLDESREDAAAGSQSWKHQVLLALAHCLGRYTGQGNRRGRQGGSKGEMLDYFLGFLYVCPLLLKHALDYIIQNYLHTSQFKSLKLTTCPCMSLKYIPYQLSAYQKSAYFKFYRVPSVQASDLRTTTNSLQQLN